MKKKLSPLILIALLTSCSLTPDYNRPNVETPAQWTQTQNTESATIARDWWTTFGSDELSALMADALVNNNDLRAGLQRIEQSRASLKIAGASLLPSADASAGASRSENRGNGDNSGRTSLNAGAGISYELDLFGANRASVAGARAGLAGTEYGQDALALVVMGDVAQGYFAVLNARERLRIADQNLDNAREVLRIVQARVDAGSESDLELSEQRSSVASREASRASVEQQITVAENALAVLLGKPPENIKVDGKNLDALKVPKIDAGQPSQLIERRPDIRAAETDLVAANADIGVARAAFFPNVNLGLNWSVAASGLADPASTALSIASSLAAPLFEGGRLEGGVERATARQAELAEIYRKTVLISFQEVEDALAAEKAAQLREKSLQTAMEQARQAYKISKDRYDAGSIDFRTLLDTQDTLLNAEDSYEGAKFDRLSAAVDLFKALGSGWQSG